MSVAASHRRAHEHEYLHSFHGTSRTRSLRTTQLSKCIPVSTAGPTFLDVFDYQVRNPSHTALCAVHRASHSLHLADPHAQGAVLGFHRELPCALREAEGSHAKEEAPEVHRGMCGAAFIPRRHSSRRTGSRSTRTRCSSCPSSDSRYRHTSLPRHAHTALWYDTSHVCHCRTGWGGIHMPSPA